ncbi:MAG: Methicillin resistance protein [Candidatus Beckwithbacteria bacterium GW2011_GWA2_43_10]|uniref:Methicillin resistance protein n=1 Tax=Candidatus Beckwithbacteria bacterium GW2011_GWA2_43_10 TaxID=1618369 RepID=A0A0G1C3X7_9BACT|nr:MAG: Methicillin resistance protein [Candidatus Beckwithbacteria bacterium GW2011_GWA2_43_10]
MIATDLRQAEEYAAYMRAIGWQAEKGMFIRRLPLVPWRFIKIQRQKPPINLKAAEKYKAIQIKLEPAFEDKTDYQALGFKRYKTPMLPSKTIWLDLTKNKRQLLKEMHYKTRYNLRKHEIRNSKFEIFRGDKITNWQLREFYAIYRENCRRQHFWGINFNQLKSLFRCFGEKAWLLATNEGGLEILIHEKVAYYSHNAATQEGKRMFVPTLLTWEAIKLAKKLGCTRFDFEGIDEQRWPGFTRFKRSFGGIEVKYKGSFTKYFFKEVLWPQKSRP